MTSLPESHLALPAVVMYGSDLENGQTLDSAYS